MMRTECMEPRRQLSKDIQNVPILYNCCSFNVGKVQRQSTDATAAGGNLQARQA